MGAGLAAVFVALAWILSALWLFIWPRWQERAVLNKPFPAAWEQTLARAVTVFTVLPEVLQQQLKERVSLFLYHVRFVGCAGMRITDEIRITIAGQASLLLLNRPERVFTGLYSVYVYPSAFLTQQDVVDEAGVVHRETQELLGESWSDGRIVLAWDEICDTCGGMTDMHVVLHEFAHHIDHRSGSANGAPLLGSEQTYRDWSEAMSAAFERLQTLDDSVIDPYGAEDPAEFFAVSTEAFFLQPQALAQQFPAVFAQLQRYFRVDPRSWYEALSQSARSQYGAE
jgi:MtfA peptidase